MSESRLNYTDNPMGSERISRLILSTGLPLMLSLLINSLYNFVDSVFVSRVGEDALTALSLAAPVQIIVSALGLGNAVGLNAAISRALGQGRPDKVKHIANSAIFLALCAWGLIAVTCIIGVRPYFEWQSGGNAQIAAYGRDYLSVCMFFALGQMGQWVFDRFVIASGKSRLFLFTLSAASLTNLVLDPIFIFGVKPLGIPAMGPRGAAIATVIGQHMGMVAGILINRRWNREIPFSLSLKPHWESVRTILRVGVPSTLVQVLTSFIAVAMNAILLSFSSTAVAVYGVCARMNGVCTVGVHGIDNGLIPIVAYNYGARQRQRVSDAVRWALIYGAALFLPFFLALELAPGLVLRLFDASEHMRAIGIPAVRILAAAWLTSIPALVTAAALQGLSLGTHSMALTVLRQALLPIALAFALMRLGLSAVWLGFVLAEALCIPLAAWLWKMALKRMEE